MSDLWHLATAQVEAEAKERRLLAARQAAAPVWTFLASSTSRQDFENRRALVVDQLDQAAKTATVDDTTVFTMVRVALEDSFIEDFETLHSERQAEAQRQNDHRAFLRAQERAAKKKAAALGAMEITRDHDYVQPPGEHISAGCAECGDILERHQDFPQYKQDGARWTKETTRHTAAQPVVCKSCGHEWDSNAELGASRCPSCHSSDLKRKYATTKQAWGNPSKEELLAAQRFLRGLSVGDEVILIRDGREIPMRVETELQLQDFAINPGGGYDRVGAWESAAVKVRVIGGAGQYSAMISVAQQASHGSIHLKDGVTASRRTASPVSPSAFVAVGQEWSAACETCGGVETGTDYYNGWPSQDAFHKHLFCDTTYADARAKAIEEGQFGPGGSWQHADCSHADGICMASSRRTATSKCVYDTISQNHSDDLLQVHHGRPEPTFICGYHEMRYSVPGSASSPLNSDGTPKGTTAGRRVTASFLSMSDIPSDFEVRPVAAGGVAPPNRTEPDDINGGMKQVTDYATCGQCGLTWDDSIVTGMTPAPAARCPFEAFHSYDEDGGDYYENLMEHGYEARHRTALAESWEALQPGDRIRVAFEESAHNGTFVGLRENSNSGIYGDAPVVIYTDDNGRQQQFVPTRGEKPRAAREARRRVAAGPAWLHERNNDPYGTPPRHDFWNSVSAEEIGNKRIFEKDGVWYGHDQKYNTWWTLGTEAEARSWAESASLDMNASRRTAADTGTTKEIDGVLFIVLDNGDGTTTLRSTDGRDSFTVPSGEVDAITVIPPRQGHRRTAVEIPNCDVCGRNDGGMVFGSPCMDCVKARHAAAMDGKCHCGGKKIPGEEQKPFGERGRKWIPCERCLGTIKQTGSRHTAGNPHAPGTPAWFEWEEGGGEGHGPQSGVPADLFPEGGVPLHGDLSPEQEAWLKRRGSWTRSVVAMGPNRHVAVWEASVGDLVATVIGAQSAGSGWAWSRENKTGKVIASGKADTLELAQHLASETGAGGWPLVPSTKWPGEKALACPSCGSQHVLMSSVWGPGGRMGDPGSLERNECADCGFRQHYKPNGDLQNAAARKTAGTPRDIGPDEELQVGDWVEIQGGFEHGARGQVSRGGWHHSEAYRPGRPIAGWYVDVYGKEMGPYTSIDLIKLDGPDATVASRRPFTRSAVGSGSTCKDCGVKLKWDGQQYVDTGGGSSCPKGGAHRSEEEFKKAQRTAAIDPELDRLVRLEWGGHASEGTSTGGFVSADGYAYLWENDNTLVSQDGGRIEFRRGTGGWEYRASGGSWEPLAPKSAEEQRAEFEEYQRREDAYRAQQKINDPDGYRRWLGGD